MTILVADDDAAVLRMIVRALEKGNFHIATATTGESLLEVWKATHSEVVLSDIDMPSNLDGIEACQAIRDLDPNVNVFLMTGDHTSQRRAQESGLPIAFFKPFALTDLLSWSNQLASH